MKENNFPLNITVLEATDTESLLDQFEEETSLADNNAEYENPKKTSNIFKAVKNHFAASGQVNPKRNPRIGNLYLFIHISSQSLLVGISSWFHWVRATIFRLFCLLFQFLVNALRMFFQRRSLNESENHLKNPEPLPLLNPFSMTLPNRMMPTGNSKPIVF